MGFKKLFETIKRNKSGRKKFRIRPIIEFSVDTSSYIFYILPTIMFRPWPYRYPGEGIINISWLHFNICIGEWQEKPEEEEPDFEKYIL